MVFLVGGANICSGEQSFLHGTSAKTAANVKEIFYEIGELSLTLSKIQFKQFYFYFFASSTK